MAFQGDLRNLGLATVFQNLQQNLQTGTLKLTRDREERCIFVKEGKLSMTSRGVGAVTPIGEYLVRTGKVSPEDVQEADDRRRKGSRLGSALERAGKTTTAEVKEAAQTFVEEELYELFTWSDGHFDFKEGTPPEDIFDAEIRAADLALNPNGIILEAARRVDEWERINRVVGSLGDIYVIRRESLADVEKLSHPRARQVAEFLDGKRDVAAIIRDSAVGRYAVCQGLSKLISERFVRTINADELRRLAEQAESSNYLEEAARFMRHALELEYNDVALRRRLAEILEQAGEKEDAASEYKLMANSLLDSGSTAQAADCLRQAILLRPSDVSSRERLFQILSDSGGKTVALETGMELAGTYSTLGLNEKAKSALERMLGLGPKDRLSIERKLVEANLALGDVKGAVVTLRKIARRLMKSRDYDEAASHYEEILKLDAKDEESRKRVAEIQAGVVERMMEHRRALVRGGILAALALPVLIFIVREVACRRAEEEARREATGLGVQAAMAMGRAEVLEKRRDYDEAIRNFRRAAELFDEAEKSLAGFRSEWGWTMASSSAGRGGDLWRGRSSKAWLSVARVYDMWRPEEAAKVYRMLTRKPGIPPDVAEKAQTALDLLGETEGTP
jgi:tetratricopeptide (TPR) repeat protein